MTGRDRSNSTAEAETVAPAYRYTWVWSWALNAWVPAQKAVLRLRHSTWHSVYLVAGSVFYGFYLYSAFKIASMSSPETCGFEGNPDIYGIGIRVGFYTQAMAAWYANYFLASEARSLRSVNLIFLFALTVCLLVYSANPSEKQAVEAFCMVTFGLTMAFVSVGLSQGRYSTRYLPSSIRQIVVYHALGIAGLGFSTWFWWTGLDYFLPTNCGTYIWVATKVDLYGWVRTYMKVGHVVGICNLAVLMWTAITTVQRHERFRRTRTAFIEHVHTQELGLTNRIRKEDQSKSQVSLSSDGVSSTSSEADSEKNQPDVSFESILEAEKYLDGMVGVYSRATSAHNLRKPEPQYDSGIISMIRSLIKDNVFVCIEALRWPSMGAEGQRMLDLNNAIAKHANGLRINAHLYRPRIFRRMVEEEKPTVGWQTLCLASDIQQSQLPLYTKNAWYIRASADLLLVLWLIVQIELTISWNEISGLMEWKSFGQLLALILGVGGLGKVIWQKIWNISHGKSEEEFRPECTSYEEGFQVYLRWKHRSVVGIRYLGRVQPKEVERCLDESPISLVPSARTNWSRRSW